jgi:hypothetical protein
MENREVLTISEEQVMEIAQNAAEDMLSKN